MGRPSNWTDKKGDEICRIIAGSNKSLKTACKQTGLRFETVLKIINENEKFRSQYARAKQDQADYLAEEIIEIADSMENDTLIDPVTGKEKENKEWVNRSRLRVDARKWVAAKLKPKKYGDKIEHSGSLEIKPITGMEIK